LVTRSRRDRGSVAAWGRLKLNQDGLDLNDHFYEKVFSQGKNVYPAILTLEGKSSYTAILTLG